MNPHMISRICKPSARIVLLALMSMVLTGCLPSPKEPDQSSQPTPSNTNGVSEFSGDYRAILNSPGGELVFGLQLKEGADGKLAATVSNGPEAIAIPTVDFNQQQGSLLLGFDHYDSKIEAKFEGTGGRLAGIWTKQTGKSERCEMKFQALRLRNDETLFQPCDSEAIAGRWSVRFSDSEDPAVGLFEVRNGILHGTFQTSTGDYRFLQGTFWAGEMLLSCFDGGHAFLFRAKVEKEGALAGHFWSRDNWHETWTAVKDDAAQLTDPWSLTHWNEQVSLAELKFPSVEGKTVSLDDPEFKGKSRILQLFGSWCPNCHDAAKFMSELQSEYGPRGLSIVGLAFEITGEAERDALQVKRYIERHRTTYPVLIVGLSDKAKATAEFKALDKIRSYPTTIFLDGEGRVEAIYTGFIGPASPSDHDKLKISFRAKIEELLSR
jgi:thiol-disulfide isomerase/thioredoxin